MYWTKTNGSIYLEFNATNELSTLPSPPPPYIDFQCDRFIFRRNVLRWMNFPYKFDDLSTDTWNTLNWYLRINMQMIFFD